MIMDGDPLNPLAGADWQRWSWMIDTVDEEEPFPIVGGLARCMFGVSPDWSASSGRTMPVCITHLPTGRAIAECPHGAAAMEATDILIARYDREFGTWPPISEDLVAIVPHVIELLQAAGCNPLLEE
jgi:hypothetical protein